MTWVLVIKSQKNDQVEFGIPPFVSGMTAVIVLHLYPQPGYASLLHGIDTWSDWESIS